MGSANPWESGNLHLETPVLSLAGCWPQKSLYVDSVLTFGWQNFEEVSVNNVLAGNLCSLFAKSKCFFLLFQTAIKELFKNIFSHIIPSQSVLSYFSEHCGKRPTLLWKMGCRGEARLESVHRARHVIGGMPGVLHAAVCIYLSPLYHHRSPTQTIVL